MQPHAPLRLLRSLIVTGVIVGLAAGGHLFGGGNLPAPMITVALAALVLVPVTWLTRRELSFTTLLGLLGAGQLVLHEAFSTLSVSAVCQTPVTGGSHLHAGTSTLHCLPSASAGASAGMDAHAAAGADPMAMLAGHVLAVLATAWFLRRGEASLWQLLAWIRPLVHILRPVAIPVAGPTTFARNPVFIPAPWRNLRLHSLRGPPAAALPRAFPC
ncbi:hypothetical protein [Arthrobacter pascens]|uniref:hypothetical protein n=1 Tax=Arthrobacter pascens TaxID=1677 RepID=UPI001F091A86|nr:hypothetical protein [Arthrobacter pascens]